MAVARGKTEPVPEDDPRGVPPVDRRYEPTLAMAVYMVVTLFMAIGAINSQNNMLYLGFGLAVGLMIASGLVSGPAMMGLTLDRRAPARARVGDRVDIRYHVRERSRLLPAFALEINERPARSPGHEGIRAAVPFVPHSREEIARAQWTPSKRGLLHLETIEVRTSFPLGLLRKVLVFRQPLAIAVAPAEIELLPRLLPSAPATRTEAARARRRTGVGDETVGLREYAAGDSARLIAWRPSASQGTLVVRQMAISEPPRLELSVEPAPDGTPTHLIERQLALAAACAEAAIHAGRRVSVVLTNGRTAVRDAMSHAALAPLHEALARYEAGPAAVSLAASTPSRRTRQRVSIVAGEAGRSGSVDSLVDASRAETWAAAPERLHPSLMPAHAESVDARAGTSLTARVSAGLSKLRGRLPSIPRPLSEGAS